MNVFKKLASLFGEVKKETNPVNHSISFITSTSSSSGTIKSSSTNSASTTLYAGTVGSSIGTCPAVTISSQKTWNPINMDTWIVDGSDNYNLNEICRQFSRLQKTAKIALTPINDIVILLTDEDKETRELATLYYEKFKSDLVVIREGLKDEK